MLSDAAQQHNSKPGSVKVNLIYANLYPNAHSVERRHPGRCQPLTATPDGRLLTVRSGRPGQAIWHFYHGHLLKCLVY